MVFSFMFSWIDLFSIGGPMSCSFWANTVAWVEDDTKMVLPPMNVDPRFITVNGFSGGASYAHNLGIIESATF